jgi:hypothetical protein
MQKQQYPILAMAEIGLARPTLGFLKIKKQNSAANIIAANNAKSGSIGGKIPSNPNQATPPISKNKTETNSQVFRIIVL